MGAWQAPSASGPEAQGSSPVAPQGWPHSVVRWLFGLGRGAPPASVAADPGRAISEHLHQPRGRRRAAVSGADGR